MTTPPETLPREAGRFRLLSELGRGGMGVVYEAEDGETGQRVALKQLSPDLDFSDESYRRFEREARLAASINHPRCVFVYSTHEIEGAPAIAMELVPGETLAERIDGSRPASIEDSVRWILDVLDGLEAARRAGLVHRDVKPANCFLGKDDRVRVGDFGLARTLAPDQQITVDGQFLGSPLYASPEQVRGQPLDTRSDVYSVGATLYALLAGRSPFMARGIGEVLSKILTEEAPPLRDLRREIPAGLARLVHRAMSKDRNRRPGTPGAMATALRHWLPSRTPAPGGRRLRAARRDAWNLFLICPGSGVLSAPLLLIAVVVTSVATPDASTKAVTESVTQALLPILMVLIYAALFLYFPVSEARRAASPGKRRHALRVVDRKTGVPCPLRAVARYAAWCVTFFITLGAVGAALRPVIPEQAGILAGFVVAFIFPFVAARRANGWRGLHELLTRTAVVEFAEPSPADEQDDESPGLVVPAGPLGPGLHRIAEYALTGTVGETATGRLFTAHDEALGREVWIHLSDSTGAPDAPDEDAEAGPVPQRWIRAGLHDGRPFAVLEALTGARLTDYATSGRHLPWPVAVTTLTQMADALEVMPAREGRAWIDAQGGVRWLRFDLSVDDTERDPLEFLRSAARMLIKPEITPGIIDRPLGADSLLAELHTPAGSHDSFEATRERLRSLAGHAAITGGMRATALLTAVLGALLLSDGALLAGARAVDSQGGWARAPELLPGVAVIYLGCLAAVLAFVFRGGAGMALGRIGLRTRDGQRATRWRCAFRAASGWLPGGALMLLGWVVRPHLGENGGLVPLALGGLLLAATAGLRLWPGRLSLQDRMAGTVWVPR